MTMIALDHSVLVDINGKLGGTNYRKDKCGLHWQTKPPKRKRKSKYEDEQRKFFARATYYWGEFRQESTKKARDSWALYGAEHLITNKKGQQKKMSAYQAFMSI